MPYEPESDDDNYQFTNRTTTSEPDSDNFPTSSSCLCVMYGVTLCSFFCVFESNGIIHRGIYTQRPPQLRDRYIYIYI